MSGPTAVAHESGEGTTLPVDCVEQSQ